MPRNYELAHDNADAVVVAWLADKRIRGQSRHTLRNSSRAVRNWRSFLASQEVPAGASTRPAGLWDADPSFVRAWQAAMRQATLRPSTINHALACTSALYEFALKARLCPAYFVANPFRGNTSREPVEEYRAARALTLDEYDRLLAHLESHSSTVSGARAHALLRTFLHTGWRPGELLTMRWEDLRPPALAGGAVRYSWTSRAGEPLIDVLPADCYQAILHYLTLAGRLPESMSPEDFIWTPIREPDTSGFGTAVDPSRPICVKTALRVLRTHLRAAGIADADRFRLHDLRHTHARLLLESGASVAVIQQRLRHSDRRTTDRYLRRAFLDEPVDKHSQAFAALRRR